MGVTDWMFIIMMCWMVDDSSCRITKEKK